MARAAVQIAVFLAVLTALAVPLGAYLQRVFGGGRRVALEGPLGPVERGLYRLLRVDPAEDQAWREYAVSMVVFSAVCTLTAYALLRVQSIHPFNPHHFRAMPWDVSFNTAVSFVTNTSWQFYAGETSLSLFSQMAVIALQSLLSMAVGLAVGIAVIRGFVRRGGGHGLGSFWVDLIRGLPSRHPPHLRPGRAVLRGTGRRAGRRRRRDRTGGDLGADQDAGLGGRRLLQRQLGDAV